MQSSTSRSGPAQFSTGGSGGPGLGRRDHQIRVDDGLSAGSALLDPPESAR
ncbi:predicted protein [Streptomyces pristinaespiralis ATCC 25486]|uniref:Predicted protein n=1 Tax=Streptomyces pristinaespiralis (strain ATCC 25486 / DSM 40338 / CBS 914.69 / JCM 4507 / KCC S-0507 / NBRC 13074 / NRRL 2958 / 5647) TaxID=457429 RepID=D6X6V3_STRE2|nr:predicted protein [Streptomyces pristinaespiralis ATCC 25486]